MNPFYGKTYSDETKKKLSELSKGRPSYMKGKHFSGEALQHMIDAQKKKYELSLFRQGLKEPQVLPEEAYQLLVFKSQFENYRSDNYSSNKTRFI